MIVIVILLRELSDTKIGKYGLKLLIHDLIGLPLKPPITKSVPNISIDLISYNLNIKEILTYIVFLTSIKIRQGQLHYHLSKQTNANAALLLDLYALLFQ